MRRAMILGIMILAPIGHAANAASLESPYLDVSVVSVAPRSTAVKPFVIAIFTNEQRQRVAAASKKTASFAR